MNQTIKTILFFITCIFCLTNIHGQRILLINNQDTLNSNSTVLEFPYHLNYTFRDTSIKISKGELLYSKNGRIVRKMNINENTTSQQVLSKCF